MKSILVKCIGFIGDHLFATSVAEYLKLNNYDIVDFQITIAAPYELIRNNPFINNVYLSETPTRTYTQVVHLQPINRRTTPTKQFQLQCGIENGDSSFKAYTNTILDDYVLNLLAPYKDSGQKVVAYLSNWEERTFLFTEEEYKRGIDVPNLGYGGKHRDITHIINMLETNNDIMLIEVGKEQGYDQRSIDLDTVSSYSLTASILKNCDYFIGPEGGLANLAAGVGCKTIITGDFIHQLYGWNGVIEKCLDPQLGPSKYFKDNHITLDPYLTDNEVIDQILDIIIENK